MVVIEYLVASDMYTIRGVDKRLSTGATEICIGGDLPHLSARGCIRAKAKSGGAIMCTYFVSTITTDNIQQHFYNINKTQRAITINFIYYLLLQYRSLKKFISIPIIEENTRKLIAKLFGLFFGYVFSHTYILFKKVRK